MGEGSYSEGELLMTSAIDALTGTLPLIVVGGTAVAMTDAMFDREPRRRSSRRRRKTRSSQSGIVGITYW